MTISNILILAGIVILFKVFFQCGRYPLDDFFRRLTLIHRLANGVVMCRSHYNVSAVC